MRNFIDHKTIKLGEEYGVNKGKEFTIKLGINRFKTIPIGKIQHKGTDNR